MLMYSISSWKKQKVINILAVNSDAQPYDAQGNNDINGIEQKGEEKMRGGEDSEGWEMCILPWRGVLG
jgi:hypothetical protein